MEGMAGGKKPASSKAKRIPKSKRLKGKSRRFGPKRGGPKMMMKLKDMKGKGGMTGGDKIRNVRSM